MWNEEMCICSGCEVPEKTMYYRRRGGTGYIPDEGVARGAV